LTNIRRHAQASSDTIALDLGKQTAYMTVGDNGREFVVPARLEEMASAGHLGVRGMAERTRLLNGRLDIHSSPAGGTRVITTPPL